MRTVCFIQITSTRLPQYKISVMIGNYTNPMQSRILCVDAMQCINNWSPQCCDGHDGDGNCHHGCDSFFTYCLRNVDSLTAGCPEGGNIMRSAINLNDASIDFSQNTVLGLHNPLVFQGLNGAWNVSISSCRFGLA